MDYGKFFTIHSQMNGLVLDVKDGDCSPGNPVVTWEYTGGDNQLWYEDHVNGVVRSKMNDDLVLDVQGDCLILNYHSHGDPGQRWQAAGDCVRNRDTGLVLDIANNDHNPGARVCSYDYNGAPNQMWRFEYQSPRLCRIHTVCDARVLDIDGNNPHPDANVIVYDHSGEYQENQLWWEDSYGVIRSKLNDCSIDTYGRDARTNISDPHSMTQQWVRCGNKIVNKLDPGTCLDVEGGVDGRNVIAFEYTGGDNQHWWFEYL